MEFPTNEKFRPFQFNQLMYSFRSSVNNVEVIRLGFPKFLLGIFLRNPPTIAELGRIATENGHQLNVPSNFRDNSTKFLPASTEEPVLLADRANSSVNNWPRLRAKTVTGRKPRFLSNRPIWRSR